jgi:hypothetical protein
VLVASSEVPGSGTPIGAIWQSTALARICCAPSQRGLPA